MAGVMRLPEGAETAHMGRSWTGHAMEDECPCPQEPCGLVAWDKAVPECGQHGLGASKTMRQGHAAIACKAEIQLSMADVIAQHAAYFTWDEIDDEGERVWRVGCNGCDWDQELVEDPGTDSARHVVAELERAGFGRLPLNTQ